MFTCLLLLFSLFHFSHCLFSFLPSFFYSLIPSLHSSLPLPPSFFHSMLPLFYFHSLSVTLPLLFLSLPPPPSLFPLFYLLSFFLSLFLCSFFPFSLPLSLSFTLHLFFSMEWIIIIKVVTGYNTCTIGMDLHTSILIYRWIQWIRTFKKTIFEYFFHAYNDESLVNKVLVVLFLFSKIKCENINKFFFITEDF